MARTVFMAACVAALIMVPGLAAAQPAASPSDMMRALSLLQDQVAAGNAIAQVGSVKMISRMAERFSTADPAVWKDKRNTRALVLYLFSGGNAAALDGSIDKDQVAKGYETLFDGAMAYALGNDDRARSLLMAVDARSVGNGLGGHLALVQATLIANRDRDKALHLLDIARLLEPGTLVEEAALRKELFLIGPSGDLEKAALLGRRYSHAFPKSIYADNFRQLMTRTAIEIGKGDSEISGRSMEEFLTGVDKRERQAILLTVAKSALIDGRLTTARLAASAAETLSDRPDTDAARAKVYQGAATITTTDYDAGLKALRSVDQTRLNDRDADLRTAALEVAAMIRNQNSTLDPDGIDDPASDRAGVKQTFADAQRALSTSTALLKRSNP